MRPKIVPQFAGPNELTMARAIAAGPTNSVVIDKQGMYWMAGKVSCHDIIPFSFSSLSSSGKIAEKVFDPIMSFLVTLLIISAGSAGSPYSSFRYMQDIMCVYRFLHGRF